MSQEPEVWRSMRGRKFDTEAEAMADDRRFAQEQIEAEQRQAVQINEATSHSSSQLTWILILIVLTFFIPCLWPLTLGLVWWIIRRIN